MRKFIIVCLLLPGCAAPREGNPAAGYVSSSEIRLSGLIQAGLDLARRNRYQEAEIKFRLALRADPALDNVKINLAEVLARQDNNEEAAKLYSQVSGSPKLALNAELGLARLMADSGENERAIESFERAKTAAFRKRDFASAETALSEQSAIYAKLGDSAMALCRAAEAHRLRREAKETANYASMLNSEHYYRKTLALFEAELNLGRQLDAEMYFARGEARYALNDLRGAISDAVKGLDLNPQGGLRVRLKLLSRAASQVLGIADVNEEDGDGEAFAAFAVNSGGFNLSAPPALLEASRRILDGQN